MSNSQIKISEQKMLEIIECASQLSVEKENKYSIEDLIILGNDAGISKECIYDAIKKIENKKNQAINKKITLKNFKKANIFKIVGILSCVYLISLTGLTSFVKNEGGVNNYLKKVLEYENIKGYSLERNEALEILNKANDNLRNFSFENTDLTAINLENSNLAGVNLSGVNFSGSGLSNSILSGSDLSNSLLVGTGLMKANMWRANLSGANLSQANLYNADLTGADLTNADLTNATLHGTNFKNVKGLTPEQVKAGVNWQAGIYDSNFRKKLGLPSQ